jgi:hypothetical protein
VQIGLVEKKFNEIEGRLFAKSHNFTQEEMAKKKAKKTKKVSKGKTSKKKRGRK